MNTIRTMLLACATSLLAASAAHAADQLLSGAITSHSGRKLEGVTVSAKLEGSTITTSVYTDTAGNYFFPPLPAGKYRVWAQALGFEASKGSVDLSTARRADFTLQEMTGPERRFRQLPGEMMVAALPEASADDARAKKIFMNNCTGCHSTSYALQFRFDEAGWSKIIDLMKVVPVTGVYPGPNAKSNQIMERHQKQLAAYLARARGPGESSMKIAVRPRPAGESARVVWTLYDLPLNPDAGIGTRYNPNDGTDWSLGTTSKMGQLPHDGALGLDGTIYFTSNNPNRGVTIGKVDPVTGLHQQQPQPRRDDRQGRSRDGRGQVPEGRRGQRPRRHHARACARPRRQPLVRRQPGPPRARQARCRHREDHDLPDAGRHVSGGRRGHHRRGRQGHGLGVHAQRRRALRSDGREIHRVQVGHSREKSERLGRNLRRGRRSRRQRLVGADGDGYRLPGRRRHRQGDRNQDARRQGRAPVRRRPRLLRNRQRPRFQRSSAVVAGSAPHGHRQERRPLVGGQFVRVVVGEDQHQDARDDDRPAPRPRDAGVSHRGRQQAQGVGQPVDLGPHRQARSRHQHLDHLRSAGAKAR